MDTDCNFNFHSYTKTMMLILVVFPLLTLLVIFFVVRRQIVHTYGRKTDFLKWTWVFLALIGVLTLFSIREATSHVVPLGMRGLVNHDGVILPQILVPGRHYISPFDSVHDYDVSPNYWSAMDGGGDVSMSAASGVSKDGVAMNVEFTLTWEIDERNLVNFKSHSPADGSYSYMLYEPIRHASSYALSKFSSKNVHYIDHDAMSEVMLKEIRKRVFASLRAQGYGEESERIVKLMSVEIKSVTVE